MIKRLKNWRTLLTVHINSIRLEPFEWGKHDCALWAASCVKVVTGEDFCKEVRGKYTTPEGAYKAIAKFYKVSQLSEALKNLFPEQHISSAKPGDIVYKKSNFQGFDCMLGICNEAYSFFVLDGEDGLTHLPILSLDGSFKVG